MSTVYTPAQAVQECFRASIVQLLFSRPCKKTAEAKARLRRIDLNGELYYQLETVKNNQAFQKNIAPEAVCGILTDCFLRFRSAECRGEKESLFFLQNNKGKIALTKRIFHAPSVNERGVCHDRAKNYLLPEGTPLLFLTQQGVMNTDGAVLKKKYHKFRQINKFLEFIADVEPLIRDTVERSSRPFSIIDFGCGKAYLSFALYHYLHERQHLPVCVHGLDLKTEVIDHCSAVAEQCGYTDLRFTVGNIADYPLPDGTGMMVCLHACDTATDFALAQAVCKRIPVIFAVPCCQHELYDQLKRQKPAFKTADHLFLPFVEYGIMTERFASLLTDTVRALLLQACGYTVQIMEFIETEHTPKNLLIRAVKKTQSLEQENVLRKDALQQYCRIKESFGIEPALEKLLKNQLNDVRTCYDTTAY